MDAKLPDVSLSEHLAKAITNLDPHRLPPNVRRTCEDLLIDCVGLCVTVRDADYIKSSLAAWDDDGSCTAIGHAKPMSPAGAAFVNGTAIHGGIGSMEGPYDELAGSVCGPNGLPCPFWINPNDRWDIAARLGWNAGLFVPVGFFLIIAAAFFGADAERIAGLQACV